MAREAPEEETNSIDLNNKKEAGGEEAYGIRGAERGKYKDASKRCSGKRLGMTYRYGKGKRPLRTGCGKKGEEKKKGRKKRSLMRKGGY